MFIQMEERCLVSFSICVTINPELSLNIDEARGVSISAQLRVNFFIKLIYFSNC